MVHHQGNPAADVTPNGTPRRTDAKSSNASPGRNDGQGPGLARRLLDVMLFGRRESDRVRGVRRPNVKSDVAVGVPVQYVPGTGSRPSSGTPFPAYHAAALSEAVREARGIIDPGRHVSSIGRR